MWKSDFDEKWDLVFGTTAPQNNGNTGSDSPKNQSNNFTRSSSRQFVGDATETNKNDNNEQPVAVILDGDFDEETNTHMDSTLDMPQTQTFSTLEVASQLFVLPNLPDTEVIEVTEHGENCQRQSDVDLPMPSVGSVNAEFFEYANQTKDANSSSSPSASVTQMSQDNTNDESDDVSVALNRSVKTKPTSDTGNENTPAKRRKHVEELVDAAIKLQTASKEAKRSQPKKGKGKPANITWSCAICGKSFNNLYKYRRHLEHHINPKDIPCKFTGCSKFFNDTDSMNRHCRSHVDKEHRLKFQCPTCETSYQTSSAVKRHMHLSKNCPLKDYIVIDPSSSE